MTRRFGMAAIATIGGLVTATACGLVIDPDKLIADNGELDDSGLPNRDVNSSDDGGGSTDAGADAPIPVVPACVPAAPAGTKGPYAVFLGSSAAPPTCPTGYLASPAATGKTDLKAEPATCGTNGCSCNSTNGPAGCTRRVSYWTDDLCMLASGDPDQDLGVCTDIPAGNKSLKVSVIVNTPSCQASGTTSPTAKPPAAYDTTGVACGADPAVDRAPCDNGQVALSPVTNARTCVVLTAGAICPPPYSSTRKLSQTGNVTDTRGCQCTCPSGTTTCTGGNVIMFGGGACGGGQFDAGFSICRIIAGADSLGGTDPTPAGFTTCGATSKATGTVTSVDDLTLCCLP